MDRKLPAAKREISCPRGVKIRPFETEQRIQVAFTFRGTECRELLPLGPISQAAVTYAAGLRAEILRKIALGSFNYVDYFPNSARAKQFEGGAGKRVLVRTLLDQQKTIYERQFKNGKLTKSTLDSYLKSIASERMSFWDGLTLPEATPSKLREWIGTLDVTSKRARNVMIPLRSVFEDALNDELIDFNPFDRVSLNKLLKQTTIASEYVVDPFTAAEREALLSKCRDDERPMVQFWFNTGLRPGELIALRWNRIDWMHNRARVDTNFVANTEKAPKTDAGVRDVHLNDEAVAGLIAQKKLTFLAGDHVWHNPRTGQAWDNDTQIRKGMWEPLCKRAGVRYRNPYQVRHTFASAHLTAGANPWYIAEQLGHVDVTLVFKTYGKFIPQDFKRPTQSAPLRVVGTDI